MKATESGLGLRRRLASTLSLAEIALSEIDTICMDLIPYRISPCSRLKEWEGSPSKSIDIMVGVNLNLTVEYVHEY